MALRQQVSLEQVRYRPLLAKEGNIGSAFCATQRHEEPGNSGNLVSPILFLHIDNLVVRSPERDTFYT